MSLPESTRVAIIGGGICGASLLYHLAQEGWSDTLLIEKGELTSGSTWHAAGQVTHSVSGYTLAAMRRYACELYDALPAESGVATTWHRSGSFRIAYHDEEVDWLQAQLGLADYVGNEMHWVGPEFIAELHPFFETSEVQGAVWTPDDGHVDPTGATNALVAVARKLGAGVSRHNRVVDIGRRTDGTFDVVTEAGTVHAEHVVNAAGCYAHQVAQMVGLAVPMANALHSYFVSTPVAEFAALERELPVVRDDYVSGYIRQEQDAGRTDPAGTWRIRCSMPTTTGSGCGWSAPSSGCQSWPTTASAGSSAARLPTHPTAIRSSVPRVCRTSGSSPVCRWVWPTDQDWAASWRAGWCTARPT